MGLRPVNPGDIEVKDDHSGPLAGGQKAGKGHFSIAWRNQEDIFIQIPDCFP